MTEYQKIYDLKKAEEILTKYEILEVTQKKAIDDAITEAQ